MTLNDEPLDSYIKKSLEQIKEIPLHDIPDIDLYMDQVTTFMEEHLENLKRQPKDKILTKTMINNYAKNHLLPPPKKKKYSREHLIMLILIYYFKGFLSFHDIQVLLEPLNKNNFQSEDGPDMAAIYENMLNLLRQDSGMRQADIFRMVDTATEAFEHTEADSDYLTIFSLITLLSYDVFTKKYLIERLIDRMEDMEQKK